MFDASQFGCDHVAAFHPEVMPEHRGQPESCQALGSEDSDEEDDGEDSVDLFLLRKRQSRKRKEPEAPDPTMPSLETLMGEQGRVEQKKHLKTRLDCVSRPVPHVPRAFMCAAPVQHVHAHTQAHIDTCPLFAETQPYIPDTCRADCWNRSPFFEGSSWSGSTRRSSRRPST